MAIVRNWLGNGLSAQTLVGNTTTGTAGISDNPFDAVNGAADVAVVASGDQPPRIQLTEPGSSRNFRWDVTPQAAYSVSFEFETAAHPSGGTALIQILDSVPTQILRIQHNSTGAFQLYNTANTLVQQVGGVIAPNTKYRVVVYGSSAGTATAKLYPAAGGAAIATVTGATGSATSAARFTFGSVAAATVTGGRFFDSLRVSDTIAELAAPTVTGTASMDVSNAGAWTATGGTATAVLADVSDATYIESPAEPSSAARRFRLDPLSRTDQVTVVTRGQASDALATIERTVQIYHGATLLVTDTWDLTTSWVDRSTVTPSAVDAGSLLDVVITDTVAA